MDVSLKLNTGDKNLIRDGKGGAAERREDENSGRGYGQGRGGREEGD